MKLAKAFGEVLKTNRKEFGLSQVALAKKCDLDRTFISMLERGERQPTITTLFAIAKALDTSPVTIVSDIEKRMRRARWARHVL